MVLPYREKKEDWLALKRKYEKSARKAAGKKQRERVRVGSKALPPIIRYKQRLLSEYIQTLVRELVCSIVRLWITHASPRCRRPLNAL